MLEVLSLPLLVECSFEDSLVGGPESETRRSLNKSKEREREKKNEICIREIRHTLRNFSPYFKIFVCKYKQNTFNET